MAPVTRIAVVDDDRMLVEGLGSWAAGVPDLHLAASAETVAELLQNDPGELDVVLLDLFLRDGSDPPENTRRLVAAGHAVLIVSLWAVPELVAETFAAGARGYLTKDHDLTELAAAVAEVAAGGTAYTPALAGALLSDPRPRRPRLSPQERAVLTAYASGMTLKAAARHAGVRLNTAKTYLERVKAKYHGAGRPTYTKIDLANRLREDSP